MIACPRCGAQVPQLAYCVACGTSLASGDAHHHRRFAAAPHEAAVALRFASTMLPRLPKAHMVAFNVSLLIGVVAVVVIAALGYYPLALGAGAFIVPLLMVVYIYDVDDYEDEPIRVTVYTIAWGVVAGAAFGFLLRAMFPGVSPLIGESLLTGVLKTAVMPLVGGAIALAGPLVLLPYRKFNDVLDGATFGATAGATFAGAQVIVQSLDLFSAGLQPGGDAVSWVIRILLHSVLLPIILGCAVGACAGAFWLRYRAPVPDRHKLGAVGRPAIALLMAALLLLASSVGLNQLRDIPSLLVEIGAGRGGAHLAPIGDPPGAAAGDRGGLGRTARHLRELRPGDAARHVLRGVRRGPPSAAQARRHNHQPSSHGTAGARGARWNGLDGMTLPANTPDPTPPQWSSPPRLSRQRPLLLFGVGFGAVLLIALLVILVFAPKASPPRCPDPDQPCSPVLPSQRPVSVTNPGIELPPPSTSTAPILRNGTAWTDSASGVQFDYDDQLWTLDTTTPAGIALLTAGQGSIVLRIEVDKASDVDAPTLLTDLEQFTAGLFTGVARDTDPRNRLLHPQIGYQDGFGEYLVGTSSEGGQITNYGFTLVTASDPASNATIGVLIAVPEPDRLAGDGAGAPRIVKLVAGLVDEVMKRVYWTPPQ